ncbi:MAG: GNAT family N-acetyltransferase [Rubricoccaceae bacterium]|nr:GNAT family N-acetyltransferase [Rubricoccaceae bacterium]
MFTKGFVPGFVWEEDGRIVGNVSLLESSFPGRYLIANVAVDPEYRRRGIARGLMEVAVEHIRQLGGQTILLQVEERNKPAISLYESLGLTNLGVMKQWETTASRLRIPTLDKESLTGIRPIGRGDWRAAAKLDAAVVDPDLNWPSPLPAAHFKAGFWHSVGDFLNGRRVETWVGDTVDGNGRRKRLIGFAAVFSEWGRPHQLTTRVDAKWRDKITAPLLVRSLARAKRSRGGVYRINHPSNDEITSQTLEEMNFKARRALAVMRLQLTDE